MLPIQGKSRTSSRHSVRPGALISCHICELKAYRCTLALHRVGKFVRAAHPFSLAKLNWCTRLQVMVTDWGEATRDLMDSKALGKQEVQARMPDYAVSKALDIVKESQYTCHPQASV